MDNDPDLLDLTRKLLAFNTVNPPGLEAACARYIGALLEEAGFELRYTEFDHQRTSLVASLPPSGRRSPIIFTGHMDTVPLGQSQWRHGPFMGQIEKDRLYGRGASDMKGALAAMILTARQIARLARGRADLTMIITAGEETCCQGARHLVRSQPDLVKAGALIVGEPTANHPYICHKGCVRVQIETSGVSAHGSMPELGQNAIHRAAEIIRELQHFDFAVPEHPFLGPPTLNIGVINGGQNINSVPDRCELGVDIRTLPGQEHEELLTALRSRLGQDIQLHVLEEAHSVISDHSHDWIQEVFEVMASIQGNRPEPGGVAYFTDASVLVPALGHPPMVILGPGEPGMAHKTDEYCSISKLQTAAAAYLEIARRWCGL